MTDTPLFQQFIEQFNRGFDPGFESLSTEMRQHLKQAAQHTFEKLALVTREEFDAQQAVLARSREKLDALEKQIVALAQQLTEQQEQQATQTTAKDSHACTDD